ncbi:diguanylate cyclase [Dethiobacter alkaliphilus]|uniref:Diguanylate cyclase n=1 Tax=Dethiobacter alkaliphilus AHT 1 TaxID=555088 RepID=C0GC94_DETAL|nr:diguanylate cyclase [Dethiobacter alkaliphilus]EEG78829.1 diguanylate cyclase [Dethiobacter alkaliphilus AHT 1]
MKLRRLLFNDGQTSIKGKLYRPILLLLIFFGVIFISVININMKRVANQEAYRLSQVLASQNLAVHTFINQEQKPSFFDASDLGEDDFIPELMSSTYMIRQINEHLDPLVPVNYYYKEVAVNARSPQNEAYDYEVEALRRFNSGEIDEIREVMDWNDKTYFVYMQPGEYMEEGCIQCHGTAEQAPAGLVDYYGPERSFGREPGELVSALSIRIPLEEAYAGANRTSLILSATYGLMLLLLFGSSSSVMSRVVVQPITSLDTRLRDTLTRFNGKAADVVLDGDEIENVSSAFDFLEERLSEAYDNLEQHAKSLEVKVEERTRDLNRVNAQLVLANQNDWLLGVLNRGAFDMRAKSEFDRMRREKGPISFVMMDLDRFKSYNDMYGREAGDKTLKRVVEIIQQNIRAYDVCGRYAGEEFVICLPNTSRQEANEIASRIVTGIYGAEIYHRQNEPFGRVTVSAGVAGVENAKDTYFERLIKEADDNMYKAKEVRNTYYPQ